MSFLLKKHANEACLKFEKPIHSLTPTLLFLAENNVPEPIQGALLPVA